MLVVVFCCDPMSRRRVDSAWASEADAARAVGAEIVLVSYEALVDERDATDAVRSVPPSPAPRLAVYRGWMLTPERYEALFAALLARGVRLVNDPAAYRHAHWLPEWLPLASEETPRSAVIPQGASLVERAVAATEAFADAALVVKDYVKSRKHEWREACFIPCASDREAAAQVIARFVELQGSDLQGGLVLREFVPLASAGAHPVSGMPLGIEARVFFLDATPVSISPYWDEAGDVVPPLESFAALARRVRSRFFTMDLGLREGGTWLVIEIGDGQVSSLPSRADPSVLYRGLVERLHD
jgi:hypothetical protein